MLKENLKKLRMAKGLSQYAVAEKIGFSRGKYANYEQGSREPDLASLERIANFFECSVDYLIGSSERLDININQNSNNTDKKVLTEKELLEDYMLIVDGQEATLKEKEGAIAFVRAVRKIRA